MNSPRFTPEFENKAVSQIVNRDHAGCTECSLSKQFGVGKRKVLGSG